MVSNGEMAVHNKTYSQDIISLKVPTSPEPTALPIFDSAIKRVNCVAATTFQQSFMLAANMPMHKNV